MLTKKETLRQGFLLAGMMNLTTLIFSKFFTNEIIPKYDPEVMSTFGLIMIAVWGLAYISVANSYENAKWLIAVFAVKKLIYGYVWIRWLLNNSLSEVYNIDVLAGAFYSVYGLNDLIFAGFFTLVFIRIHKS